jgi:membrane dipeptidase
LPPEAPHVPIYDGHNDALLRLWRHDRSGRSFFERGERGHIDLPRAREGGLAGGIFATFVANENAPRLDEMIDKAGGAIDLPAMAGVAQSAALTATIGQAAILYRLARESVGALRVCRTVAEIRAAMADGVFAAVLHSEGAEPIGPDLDELEVLYQAGLRSLGLVWSRQTIFGEGVPFRFPASPDTGPGLTERGEALVRACNRLGVMIDLSHLNEKGFWDVARISEAPLVATHSNVHALSPVSRNLTDWQLAAIRETGGVVGLNFAVSFLREDARRNPDTPLEVMVRHLDHMLEKAGPTGVALGSDFDGALVPAGIGDAAGLPNLVAAMRAAGYDDDLIAGICHRNWLSVLDRTWRA